MSDEADVGIQLSRREALGLIAAASIAPALSCSEAPTPRATTEKAHTHPRPSRREAVMPDPILGITPLIKGQPWPTLEPFLFCVHHDDDYPEANERFGPAASLAGRDMGRDFGRKDGWSMYHGRQVPGFPRHPHRGFETVTVVRRGLVDHSDSLGAAARYGEGDVQWLTAGDGINHAEMFPLLNREGRNPIDFFQIWLNLPLRHKLVPPSFAMYWESAIPKVTHKDEKDGQTTITVIAGQCGPHKGPTAPRYSWAAEAENDVAIWTIKMDAGANWILPKATQGAGRALYVLRGGGVGVNGQEVTNMSRIMLRPEMDVSLSNGGQESELLLLGAQPIGEPVAHHGPFVMNTREELQEAYRDYQTTQFGGWPWPDDAPTHGSAKKRFARHSDGRVEEAS